MLFRSPADSVDADNDALINELIDLEVNAPAEKVEDIRGRAKVDTAEVVELMDPEKISEMIQLHKA